MEKRKPFTVEDGLIYQRQHLKFYKTILKPEYYEKVLAKVKARNKEGYKSGYDVCRGSDIDNIVANILRD